MNKEKKAYRTAQLDAVKINKHYMITIVLSSMGGGTNYLNITDAEFAAIKAVLIGEVIT